MAETGAISIPQKIADALSTASRRTGTGFDYLLKTAVRESGLKPSAKAETSSASGLFQFVEQTWLATVKQAGPDHGLAAYAGDIARGADGRYKVADPAARQEILALRNDPLIASVMAGELTDMNREELSHRLGRSPSDGELYIGHFLGPRNAATLIGAAAGSPDTPAADLFPAAARANRSIFYDGSGAKRDAGEVYQRLVRQHDRAGGPVAVAEAGGFNPFAGLIAFFEGLFSTAPARLPASLPAGPPAGLPASPPAPISVAAAFAPPAGPVAGAERADLVLAARTASHAYGHAAATGAGLPRPAFAQSAWPVDPDAPWGGSLFTNAAASANPFAPLPAPPAA